MAVVSRIDVTEVKTIQDAEVLLDCLESKSVKVLNTKTRRAYKEKQEVNSQYDALSMFANRRIEDKRVSEKDKGKWIEIATRCSTDREHLMRIKESKFDDVRIY